MPCRSFSFGLVMPQLADAPGRDAHGQSITALASTAHLTGRRK
jgi:hypothetical protein